MSTVRQSEYWTFIGILLSAGCLGIGGEGLWNSNSKKTKRQLGTKIDFGPCEFEMYFYFLTIHYLNMHCLFI